MDAAPLFFPTCGDGRMFSVAALRMSVIPPWRIQDPSTLEIMSDETERDASAARARADAETSEHNRAEPKRKRWALRIGSFVVLVPLLLISLWTAVTLNYSYSTGYRAGALLKFSRKGWLCKTWEGELQMNNTTNAMPVMPEVFYFTVRNDSVAQEVNKALGQRVVLDYNQHRGVPGSCFGETQYYVTHVRPIAP